MTIDAQGPAQPFPHSWEQMFGSGRAILSLRESYREDLRQVKRITGFHYVRFHAILDDEVGVYGQDAGGHATYNFQYVDQIYDGLLREGVRPFVELSFMPKLLAARLDYHPFWYHPIVSPPADYDRWEALIRAFAQHLVDRYGIDEVSQWYFEVWNEPNIDFWTGRPAQESYFELYDHTARALKQVSARLRVGGPATAQAAWVDAMIAHAAQNHIPLDFVSSHAYGNDTAMDIFGRPRDIPPHQMVCPAVEKVHRQILDSASPHLPLIWSEFNATYMSDPQITDSIYMGPWLAQTIRNCAGEAEMMSFWTFSDVFEEQGVIRTPFFGGFGLIAMDHIPKASFRAFELLHALGDVRLPVPADDLLATRRRDGTLVLAAWNAAEPGTRVPEKSIRIAVKGAPPNSIASIQRLDGGHGDVLAADRKMGSPAYPSREQLAQLRAVTAPEQPDRVRLHGGVLTLDIPPQGLAVVEIGR